MATINIVASAATLANFAVITQNGSAQVRPMPFGAQTDIGNPDHALGAAFVQGSSALPLYLVQMKGNSEQWVDVGSYVTKFSIKRTLGDTFHKVRGGEAKLTVYNECSSMIALYGGWNPFSGVSYTGSFSQFTRPYRAIQITAQYSLYSYPLFTGTVKDISIETGKDGNVNITAVDQLQNVFDKDIVQSYQAWNNPAVHTESFVQVNTFINFDVASVFKTFMPSSYGYATIGVSCDAGVSSWSLYMFHYNSEDKDEAIKELVEYAGLAIYATTDGNIRVRDTVHKATSYFSFNDPTGRNSQALSITTKIDRFGMINKAVCKFQPTYIQSLGTRVNLFQINSPVPWEKPLGSNSYFLDLWLESQGVEGASQRGSPVTPRQAGVAFYLEGLDVSPVGHAQFLNLYVYGSRLRVVSTLNSAGTINSLCVQGAAWYVGADMLAQAENLDSQAQYDIHKDEFKNRFWNTTSAAVFRAYAICSERAYPAIEFTTKFRNQFPQVLQIDLMDRLFIPQTVPTSKCLRVYGISHDVNLSKGTMHTVTYTTEVDTFNVSS